MVLMGWRVHERDNTRFYFWLVVFFYLFILNFEDTEVKKKSRMKKKKIKIIKDSPSLLNVTSNYVKKGSTYFVNLLVLYCFVFAFVQGWGVINIQ